MWPKRAVVAPPPLRIYSAFELENVLLNAAGEPERCSGAARIHRRSSFGRVYIEFGGREAELRWCFCGLWLPASGTREPASSTTVARPGGCVSAVRSRALR